MKQKEIEIYSLADADVFWAVIKNFLGWSYECSYRTGSWWKAHNFDKKAEKEKLLKKVVEKGGHLRIYHLFTPFVESDLAQSNRRFLFDAMELIRFIEKTKGLKVVWDVGERCKETLLRNSPPLYYRIYGKEECI